MALISASLSFLSLRSGERYELAHVVQWAAPAAQPEQIPIGIREKIVGEVRAHHPADAGDQGAPLGGNRLHQESWI